MVTGKLLTPLLPGSGPESATAECRVGHQPPGQTIGKYLLLTQAVYVFQQGERWTGQGHRRLLGDGRSGVVAATNKKMKQP